MTRKTVGQKSPPSGNITNNRRWLFSLLIVGNFSIIALGLLLSIHLDNGQTIDPTWKELLLLLLGALIGNYGKVMDYWFIHKSERE